MRNLSRLNLAGLIAMSLSLGCSNGSSDQSAATINSATDSNTDNISSNAVDVTHDNSNTDSMTSIDVDVMQNNSNTENITSIDVEVTNNNTDAEPTNTAQADDSSNAVPLTPMIGEPMLFLSNLNGPPYGNLPIVDHSPRLPSLELRPDEVRQRYNGCLLVSYGITYCYKPETRLLSGYLTDGDLFWSFNLPGNSDTNRVDQLNATASMDLFANVTTEFGQPKHEASEFWSGGEFNQTRRLFELDGEIYPKVNIQGEPLAVDYRFSNASAQTCINANTYELMDGGNSADPNDWRHSGAMYTYYDSLSSEPERIDIVEGVLIEHPSIHTVTCGYQRSNTNISLRNSAQAQIQNVFKEASTYDMHSAASALVRFANDNEIIDSYLPCSSSASNIEVCSRLDSVGSSVELATDEAECGVFQVYVYAYEHGTVQLNTSLERVTETQIRVTQEFNFSDYCKIPSGYLRGTGSIVSTVDSRTGAILERVTHFENLTATLFNFVGGTHTITEVNDTQTSTINAESIGLLRYCTRSCHPGPFLFKTLQAPSTVFVSEDGGGSQVTSSWVSIPNLGQESPKSISLDWAYLEDGDFFGHIEFQQDNATVRAETTTKAQYQNLSFFRYTVNKADQPALSWDVPAKGFPDSLVYSYSEN